MLNHSYLGDLTATSPITSPCPDTCLLPGEVIANETKAQPWKAFVKARIVEPSERFDAGAAIRIIRGEEMAPLLILGN